MEQENFKERMAENSPKLSQLITNTSGNPHVLQGVITKIYFKVHQSQSGKTKRFKKLRHSESRPSGLCNDDPPASAPQVAEIISIHYRMWLENETLESNKRNTALSLLGTLY